MECLFQNIIKQFCLIERVFLHPHRVDLLSGDRVSAEEVIRKFAHNRLGVQNVLFAR